ncbi:MAG: hypothetical protein Q4F01_04545 [Staphylococcus rostri]|uniref:hypothetical protein n=1 Tax=Staphylococcus rostri TaxID=522262 RepID=UPI0026E08BB5|nr:hypothetical protein [Staphylococcus rostri]MDO5375436.1 hypothetical protein [Staphylococcus rostri]
MNQAPNHNKQMIYQKRHIKKRRSGVSFILTLIAMVLTAIAAYSMYHDPLFTSNFLNTELNYKQLQQFNQELSSQTFVDLSDFEQVVTQLSWTINGFFILCFVNIVLAILTLVYNRTLLKIVNFIVSLCIFFIPVGLLVIIRDAAKQLSAAFEPIQAIIGNVNATDILAESNAVHNAIIFTGIAAFLYFISLFFRNRRPKSL